MLNTTPAESIAGSRRAILGLIALSSVTAASAQPSAPALAPNMTTHPSQTLTPKQAVLGPIAAATAIGDIARLVPALNRGLDAGWTINELKEVLVQMYAYAGFPRSLNALGEFMKVLNARKQKGVRDTVGSESGPVPTGAELLAEGTANQTKLSGSPVRGPLFDFAPAIDQYLKTHLFGDIFARSNLDWQSRELATVAALAALEGTDSQLLAHNRISMNVGITAQQLSEFAANLGNKGFGSASKRATEALSKATEPVAK